MLNIAPIAERRPHRTEPVTLDGQPRSGRLQLAADGMTATAILDAITQLIRPRVTRWEPGDGKAEVVVDVTNAWSIPWTTQAVRVTTDDAGRTTREAYVRHKGFRWAADRTEAVYEVVAA